MHHHAAAIGDVEAERLLAPLRRYSSLLLAVSGGPDSLALLHLVNAWRGRIKHAPEIAVATVDHGLRSRSAEEAREVAGMCDSLGLPHTILEWNGDKPTHGIQAAARHVRYSLMLDLLRNTQPAATSAIVTAHHLEDQAETFIMRLMRGSGIDGLTAMPIERSVDAVGDVAIVRPLLSVSKARLKATLAALSIAAFDDPSNSNDNFERIRVRHLLDVLGANGLTAEKIALTCQRLYEAKTALDESRRVFVATLGINHDLGCYTSLSRGAFEQGSRWMRQRVLQDLISRHGGSTPAPRLSEVEALASRLSDTDHMVSTLGGACVRLKKSSIEVWREAGRATEQMSLKPGESKIWDNRFVVALSPNYVPGSGEILVSTLGETGYEKIAGHIVAARKVPSRAAFALPAFRSGNHILAVPQLGYFYDETERSIGACTTQFKSEPIARS